jgi:hypothetical protein
MLSNHYHPKPNEPERVKTRTYRVPVSAPPLSAVRARSVEFVATRVGHARAEFGTHATFHVVNAPHVLAPLLEHVFEAVVLSSRYAARRAGVACEVAAGVAGVGPWVSWLAAWPRVDAALRRAFPAVPVVPAVPAAATVTTAGGPWLAAATCQRFG